MANPKPKWTAEEEKALTAGVAKHGTGKWKVILDDPEFNPRLSVRSNDDLKQKWRSIKKRATGHGQGSKGSFLSLSGKASVFGGAEPSSLLGLEEKKDDILPGSSQDPKNVAGFDEILREALVFSNSKHGFDLESVVDYIQDKYGPQNLESLKSKVMELVLQGKLEQFPGGYKINKDAFGTQTPAPKQKDVRPSPLEQPTVIIVGDSLEETKAIEDEAKEAARLTAEAKTKEIEDAAKEAARWIAEAEHKAFLAAEAVREVERISQMQEENPAILKFAEEMLVLCSQGDDVLIRID